MRRLSHSWWFIALFLSFWFFFVVTARELWVLFSLFAIILYGRDLMDVAVKVIRGENGFDLARPLLAALVFCSWPLAIALSQNLIQGITRFDPAFFPASHEIVKTGLFILFLYSGLTAISIIITFALIFYSGVDTLQAGLARIANYFYRQNSSSREVVSNAVAQPASIAAGEELLQNRGKEDRTTPAKTSRWQRALLGANILTVVTFIPLAIHFDWNGEGAILLVEEVILRADFVPNSPFEAGVHAGQDGRHWHEYGERSYADLSSETMVHQLASGGVIVAEKKADWPIMIWSGGGSRPMLAGRYNFYRKDGYPSTRFIDKVR